MTMLMGPVPMMRGSGTMLGTSPMPRTLATLMPMPRTPPTPMVAPVAPSTVLWGTYVASPVGTTRSMGMPTPLSMAPMPMILHPMAMIFGDCLLCIFPRTICSSRKNHSSLYLFYTR